MAIADLEKIREDAVAAADAEIAAKTAARHAYLRGRLFGADGSFNASACNDAELAAIKKNLGDKTSVDMGRDEERTGDQDLVDYVLSECKGDKKQILTAIKEHEAAVAAAPPRVPSSAARV